MSEKKEVYIDALTPEQEAKLPYFRDKWITLGLTTEPVDWKKAEAAVRKMYECVGLKQPSTFYYADNPKQMMLMARDMGLQDTTPCYGSMDADWCAFYEAIEYLGVKLPIVEGLVQAGYDCGWFIATEEWVVLCDRPSQLHRDGIVCHNEDGPAVAFERGDDKFYVWVLNGVRVDEQIVMRPETQTVEQINNEENEEVKRIRIERYGWERYIKDAGFVVVDSRSNDIEGTKETLYGTPASASSPIKVLVCACPSTAKVFSLEVDPDVCSCEEAQSYLSSGFSKRIINAS